MNLSKFLPGFAKGDEPTEEQLDAEDAAAKAARIQYHRDHVRNGPRSPAHTPPGRLESLMRRHQVAQTRRANVAARKDWIRANKDLSRLRGQLEVVAQTELAGTPVYENAMRGLFDGYGALVTPELPIIGHTGAPEDDDRQPIHMALDFALPKHRTLVVQAAVHHYRIATGQVAA